MKPSQKHDLVKWISLYEKCFDLNEICKARGVFKKKFFIRYQIFFEKKLKNSYENYKNFLICTNLDESIVSAILNIFVLKKTNFFQSLIVSKAGIFKKILFLNNFKKIYLRKMISKFILIGVNRIMGFVNHLTILKNFSINIYEMEIDFVKTVLDRYTIPIISPVALGNVLLNKMLIENKPTIDYSNFFKKFIFLKNLKKKPFFALNNYNNHSRYAFWKKKFIDSDNKINKYNLNEIFDLFISHRTKKYKRLFCLILLQFNECFLKMSLFYNITRYFFSKEKNKMFSEISSIFLYIYGSDFFIHRPMNNFYYFLSLKFKYYFKNFLHILVTKNNFFCFRQVFEDNLDLLTSPNLRCFDEIKLDPGKNLHEIFQVYSHGMGLKDSFFFILYSDWVIVPSDSDFDIKKLLTYDLFFKKKKLGYYIFISSFELETNLRLFLKKIKKNSLIDCFKSYYHSFLDYFILEKKRLEVYSFLSESFYFFKKLFFVKNRYLNVLEFERNYQKIRIKILNLEIPKIENFKKKKIFKKIKKNCLNIIEFFKEYRYQRKIRSLFNLNLKEFFTHIISKKKCLLVKEVILKQCVYNSKMFLKIKILKNKYVTDKVQECKYLPVTIFRSLKLFSKFFFHKITNRQKFEWNFASARVMLETRIILHKESEPFFISSDLSTAILLTIYNHSNILSLSEIRFLTEPFFSKKSPTSLVDLEKKIFFKVQKDFSKKEDYIMLGNYFVPKSTFLKLPIFSETLNKDNSENVKKAEADDFIYVCEANMVKCLKTMLVVDYAAFFIEIKRRLEKIFIGDIRGFVLQLLQLNKKEFVKRLKSKKKYKYLIF